MKSSKGKLEEYSELNKNENTYQNLWDTTKAVLREGNYIIGKKIGLK